jgi:hypothetical protein
MFVCGSLPLASLASLRCFGSESCWQSIVNVQSFLPIVSLYAIADGHVLPRRRTPDMPAVRVNDVEIFAPTKLHAGDRICVSGYSSAVTYRV